MYLDPSRTVDRSSVMLAAEFRMTKKLHPKMVILHADVMFGRGVPDSDSISYIFIQF